MNQLDTIQKSLDEATTGFKQMQYALLVFAALSGIGLLVAAIAIFKTAK